jgi:hypothetical protein
MVYKTPTQSPVAFSAELPMEPRMIDISIVIACVAALAGLHVLQRRFERQ